MGRRKGSKNKPKKEVSQITKVTNEYLSKTWVEDTLKKIDLKSIWQQLKEAGFPQGGVGNWLQGENDRYYIPSPSEIYQHFIADPAGWEDMSKAMATVWLNRKN